ncbi:MAG: hypothetical protein ABIQ09_06875 [Jatrophihabitantaceae bacterium]
MTQGHPGECAVVIRQSTAELLETSSDLSLFGAEGAAAQDIEVGIAFTAKLREAATRDPVLAQALARVTEQLDSTETLMTADIVARVFGPRSGR